MPLPLKEHRPHPLVVNKHVSSEYDVYVGRPSEWGNPYSHLEQPGTLTVATREEAIEEYRGWLMRRINSEPGFMTKLAGLHGKRLACWCAPKPCHAHVLARAAEWAWKTKNSS